MKWCIPYLYGTDRNGNRYLGYPVWCWWHKARQALVCDFASED